MQEDIFSMYLAMIGENEAPNTYHRWSLLSVLGAWIGRRYFMPFGDSKINCNMYVMLMGHAGARKTTSINRAIKLLKTAGYNNIAANKTSKEKFLLDLAGDTTLASDDILDSNLFGNNAGDVGAEIMVAAEEFNVFLGNGNIEFLSLLGSLWDYEGAFENKVKNSVSAYIYNPTVSILAGNTATNFALAFPIEAIGQGIFSRLLLVHGDKTNRKITIPNPPNEMIRDAILKRLADIRKLPAASITLHPTAYKLIDKIYKHYPGMSDIRFESYNNRRLTHLLKLCLIGTIADLRLEILESDVLKANTILAHAEYNMPKALGEFGKSKNSDITHKVLNILNGADVPVVTFKSLWKQVHNDCESTEHLRVILSNLVFAEKIVAHSTGFASKTAVIRNTDRDVDFDLLTEEERGSIIL